MEDRIQALLNELIEADPSLAGREAAVRGLLRELLAGRPDAVMDPAFRARLKLQLVTASALRAPRLAGWRRMRLYYGISAVALIVILMVVVSPDQPGQVAFRADDAAIPAAAPEAGDTRVMTLSQEAGVPMQLTSSAFSDGQAIPAQYTCDGDSLVPPLAWSGVPEGTGSLALMLDDPDAPREGGFTHWVVYDIPSTSASVQGTDGANSTGRTGYVAPCPPSGAHRYVFTLFALDAALGLQEGIDRDGFLAAAEGHILATAQLIGIYQRR